MSRQEHLIDFDPYPWCRQVISSPAWRPLTTRSTSTNRLFTETLWTDVTIRAHASFYKPPTAAPPTETGGEVRLLVSLGAGLDGHPGYCHGGMLALIFDDTIHELVEMELKEAAVTATLNVSYRRPVATPAVVLCRVWSDKEPVGRKWVVRATIEDGFGGVFAECESLVVKRRKEGL
ncbi:hypothetical protein KXW39_000821 [Aspergillus fumigatus]|nr:hypothetical protein KXX06_004667 [Aspergillus fumigatus]KAH1515609.1 hypothetical protein KXX29_009732 [Aspergillus fumigatus]KAH1569997.1 hypothetical protein KXX17_001185 [Aspergillus fumigatus]KAH2377265.1 hypothetical protein KXV62_000566 [Aspergillus fumigatus]KAH3305514.1 hypothetical protein KXV87_000261 [Aspergillus fumigatus]